MTILILGGTDDEHAMHVLNQLRARGHDAEILDSRDFPTRLTIAYDPTSNTGELRLPSGRRLELAQIRSVYWRCYHGQSTATLPDAGQAHLATNDARSLFESLLINLPAKWVNGWSAYRLHQTKPAQLARVAALGVPVPATLLGNDPSAVRAFAARHSRCVFKPVQGGAHTRRLEPRHLSDANLRNLALAPVTIQEEVPGTDVRVFVAGEHVLACEVKTAAVDFRDDPNPTIAECELPADVTGWCLRAARALELVWTGIDLRRRPEGGYVFLEANPSPMFLGFELQSGLPLTERLVELLTVS
jgi:glutathione synthase/RimK-type ligase-like ATP-grasp enzyme